jgi:hypothetical protein
MAKHLPTRTMADVKEPLVLFLIGMRIKMSNMRRG